jgi:hypothetical protein
MSMLPTVDFCGLNPTRLIIGANPFGGFSHQNPERDAEMVAYYTPERIRETWARAEAAGINTMITNNETPHVLEAVIGYLSDGGPLQWIAQISNRSYATMNDAVDRAVSIGCKALYFHGGIVDGLYAEGDDATLRAWVAHARSHGIPVGVAGHAPETHYWADRLDLVDFHVVCLFNCGSLHAGKGHKFRLADLAPAAECTRRLAKPCIAYKIMAAGRIDPVMAFEYAFENIKPTDVVNVGMYRGDKDGIVEEDVEIVRGLLEG